MQHKCSPLIMEYYVEIDYYYYCFISASCLHHDVTEMSPDNAHAHKWSSLKVVIDKTWDMLLYINCVLFSRPTTFKYNFNNVYQYIPQYPAAGSTLSSD